MRQMLLNVTFVCLAATCLTNSAKAQYVDADDTTSVIIPVMLDELPFLLGESAYWARTAAAAETYAARSYPAYQQQCLAAASFYHAADELALYAIAAYVSADPAKSDYVDRLKDCEAYARLSRQYANLGYQYGRFSRNYGHLSIVRSDECIELLVRVWPML